MVKSKNRFSSIPEIAGDLLISLTGRIRLVNFSEAGDRLFRDRQFLTLLIFVTLGSLLIISTIIVATLNTIIIFIFVAFIGLYLCRQTCVRLRDSSLAILGYFWLIKLIMLFILLYIGWIPELENITSVAWGYDPQRYYQYAIALAENSLKPDFVEGNYQGIIYYYGFIFYLFGHNPVIPALINALVTLLGTLYLIKLSYEFKSKRNPRDWSIAFLLLIPEMLWYDVMTSRESLIAVLIIFSVLSFGRYIVQSSYRATLFSTVIIISVCLSVILFVRTTMAIPVIAAFILIFVFLVPNKNKNLLPLALLALIILGLFISGPVFQKYIGGIDVDYLSLVGNAFSIEGNIASEMEWSERSIGLLIAPHKPWQAILFLPVRMVAYLVAPLPNIAISFSGLIANSHYAWQHFFTILTSLINVVIFPFVLSGTLSTWENRKKNAKPLVIHLAFWITFIAIAGGNIIIHERYRVMMMPLLYACAWFGFTSHGKFKLRWLAYTWYGLFACGVLFYFVYKYLL